MAIKIYKSTEFEWDVNYGGFADVSKLVVGSKFTTPPKKFYVQDHHKKNNRKWKLLFELVDTVMDKQFKNTVTSWHYKAPHSVDYEEFEGAEIVVFNI